MGNIIVFNPCSFCEKKDMCSMCELQMYREKVIENAEWISVDERLPDTTPKKVTILDQEISSGKIVNETDAGIAQVSELVAVLCKRCIDGKVGLYHDFDYTMNNRWVYTQGVTHWMPLPEAPKMKGGEQG